MTDLAAIRQRWSTEYDRGAHDYEDAGCRVLAEHAFRDVPLLLDIAEAAIIQPGEPLGENVGHWWRGTAHWFDPASTPDPTCPLCAALSAVSADPKEEA